MPSIETSAQQHKNEAHIAGVLFKDPEIRHTSSGKSVASLTIVTKRDKFSEYHKVVVWERLADKARSLAKKGDFVKVVGRLQTRSWEDPQSKQKKYSTEIVAFQFVIPDKEPVTVSTSGAEITDADFPF